MQMMRQRWLKAFNCLFDSHCKSYQRQLDQKFVLLKFSVVKMDSFVRSKDINHVAKVNYGQDDPSEKYQSVHF